jgi:hypothetical protein
MDELLHSVETGVYFFVDLVFELKLQFFILRLQHATVDVFLHADELAFSHVLELFGVDTDFALDFNDFQESFQAFPHVLDGALLLYYERFSQWNLVSS